MIDFNVFKPLCLEDSIFINRTANSTILPYLLNDCFIQLVLSIPFSIVFLTVNSYQYGLNAELSRHVNSKQLKFYRLFSILLTLSLLIKFILTYLAFDIDYEISSASLISDLFQIFSTVSHLHLLFNKQIFKNLDFRNYPISLFCVIVFGVLVNHVYFLNQLLRYLYLEQSRNKLLLLNVIINGFYCVVMLIYAVFISLFYKIKCRNLLNLNNLVSEEDKSNYYSYLSFAWLQEMMRKGYRQDLKSIDDMPQLPEELNINSVCKDFTNNYTDRDIDENPIINPDVLLETRPDEISFLAENRTLIQTFVKSYGREFMVIGVFKMMNDFFTYAGPLLMNRLVEYIETDSQDFKIGCMYASGLFFWSILISLFGVLYNYRFGKLCLRIRTALMDLIYTKTVQIELNELNDYSIGKIDNLMSVDTETIVRVFPCIHEFWSLPFQIILTFYLLYQQIGLSFLVGIGFVVLVTPINKVLTYYIAKLQEKFLNCKDARVKVISEFISGIRVVKFYTWESYFSTKIKDLRQSELNFLQKKKYLEGFIAYFWTCTPIVVSVLTFMTYALLGNELRPSKVFTTMALFHMLVTPLNSFPWVISGLLEGWVSYKRLRDYLNTKNLNWYKYYKLKRNLSSNDNILINVKNASFKWNLNKNKDEKMNQEQIFNSDSEHLLPAASSSEITDNEETGELTLNSISFTIEKSKFIGVIGKVGTGKTSLLNAILGEISKFDENSQGVLEIDAEMLADGIAYVAQDCWVQASTIRDNILFGEHYEEEKYKRVLFACALDDDLQVLSNGDQTKIGENGITLSGGQKARLCLARACYQNKSLYLLDDPFSAVDTNVAKHIYDHCINGLLANKTRILSTHHLKFLLNADSILVIDKNTVVKQGPSNEILPEYMNDNTIMNLAVETDEEEAASDIKRLEGNKNVKIKDEDNINLKENDEEEKEEGFIDSRVYKYYCQSIGIALTMFVLLLMVLTQASSNLTVWWLSYWTQHHYVNTTLNAKQDSGLLSSISVAINSDMKFFFIIYGSLCLGNSVLSLIRAFVYVYSCTLASKSIHDKLIKNLFKARIKFYDNTPQGRIINRVSSDMYSIDDSLPFMINLFSYGLLEMVGILAITCYSLPWITLAVIPIFFVYYKIQNYFRWTSRELKRLNSIAMSPVFNNFNETLNGLVTIRSFRLVKKFMRKHRICLGHLIRLSYVNMATSQWLNFRSQITGALLITIVSFMGLLQHTYGSNASASLIGLSLAYILNITEQLNFFVETFISTEKELVSVERVLQYKKIEPENWNGTRQVEESWPVEPTLEFINVRLNYELNSSANALDGISFNIKAGEKVGVCGRTGSGKSSLFLAIMRAFEINEGHILINNVDTRELDLKKLREKISIISQDPFLFFGTLRENLDPYKARSDTEIWNALEKCRLIEKIRNLNKGLDYEVESQGRNFSNGEKQLICLARAILSQTKLLCIDEATASVDFETDKFIQETIRNEFKSTTVLTIAHRLNTIFDYDRILVMEKAKVAEFDTVDNLMANKNSIFYSLIESERKQMKKQK